MYVLRDILCRWYVSSVYLKDNMISFNTTQFIDVALKFIYLDDALDIADTINTYTQSKVELMLINDKEIYPNTLKEFDNVYYSKNK